MRAARPLLSPESESALRRPLSTRVVAIVNRRLRGQGSGIDIEDKLGIVYELRDGLAIRIRGYRNVVEALAGAEHDG